ncbi:hypothetical protein BHE90_002218 [Fusarium euwallaceae]|uniref:Uncharacterized protein n=1 Tax=Fusarium euwallaceae TaxID=1147111 RepID=A0A430M5N5_9HYPO|nr:hypothetical protein BHE90_002218 [Fusarium euwallaceae]
MMLILKYRKMSLINAAGQQQQQEGPRILPLPVRPEGTRLLWVDCSGQQLAPYTKNKPQRDVLALPGRPVTFLKDRVRLEQVTGMRDSYVNAFLIQSRGVRTSAQTSTLPAAESPDDVPIVISEDESSVVSELAPCDNEEAIPPADNDGGDLDLKPEPHDDDDNEMDLVPIVDNGLAGDGTAENPLQID